MSSELTEPQQRALVEDGYVHLPGVVPRPLCEQALRAINGSLGTEGLPREQLPTFRARSFTPELCQSEPIRDLYTAGPLPELAAAALGAGKVRPPSEGQIALRFPTADADARAWPHIDGISSPANGVPAGTLYHFTALAGVFLSDCLEPDHGNFTVWPGSHRLMEAHLRAHGLGSIVGGFPPLALSAPRPLLVRAGDAVLAHYQLAHAAAPNRGPHIRYAVFFRLFHVDHTADDTRPLTNLWWHWEGLRPLVGPFVDPPTR